MSDNTDSEDKQDVITAENTVDSSEEVGRPTQLDESAVEGIDFENQEEVWELGEHREGYFEFGGVYFKLEEPKTDQEVAELTSPTVNAQELYWRSVSTIVTKPDITEEMWEEKFTAKERGQLAHACLDWWGADDFIDEAEMGDALEEVMNQKEQEAKESQEQQREAAVSGQ